jgi:hypothetical protein
MSTNADRISGIATTLRDLGVSATRRSALISEIRAAVTAGEDRQKNFYAPVSIGMSAAEERELTYAAKLALASARRVGVSVDARKGISLDAFNAQARGEPTARMIAKSQLADLNLLHE